RPENTEKMWSFVEDGTIDMITSDHTDYLYKEKEAAIDDIWNCENGMPGVGTLAPIVINECMNKRNFKAEKVAELLSSNAAKVFGLYPRKGVIRPGSDADFTIVDLD